MFWRLKRRGHILVARVGFSFEEYNWFHCQSFRELLILGQNLSEILNWVKKILAPELSWERRIETIVMVVWTRMGEYIKMNNGPPKCQLQIPPTCRCYLIWKKSLCSRDWIKTLAMGRLSGIIRVVLNSITCSFKRGRGRFEDRQKEGGSVIWETEIGVMQPHIKECQQPWEAERDQEHVLP